MTQQRVNEDLRLERLKCMFNKEELTNLLDGGKDNTIYRRKFINFFVSDNRLKDEVPFDYLSHQEFYEQSVRKNCILCTKIKEWLEISDKNLVDIYGSIWHFGLDFAVTSQGVPFTVHTVMFTPALLSLGNREQQDRWFRKALNNEIIGTYAQTELGHGTFIRGLETTCTYDPTTEEFILNSPTLTSYKWWPGGLGHTCNYAIVVSQLYTQGKCHGIHPFIVQLRDSETWMPLPGIKLGEIGSKLGMNGTNNGYLAFDNVRIPRRNMLMKNSKVLKDGTYEKSINQKLTYGTMIFVRVLIVRSLVTNYLMKASTIAIRYSAVRRQSELKAGEKEPQILDYQTQQYKLFPAIATALAYKFSANWLWDVYHNVNSQVEKGDLKRLPELHAMACCLKSVGSSDAAVGVTACRLACGGHGYMNCSNLPNIYGLTTAMETYEGENTVLLLQTARYLLKAFQESQFEKPLPQTLSYLKNYKLLKQSPWTTDLECMTNAFFQVSGYQIENCHNVINQMISNGTAHEDAWNAKSILLSKASEAHCRAFVISTFVASLKTIQVSPEVMAVLTNLCQLISAYWTLNNVGIFLQCKLYWKNV
ncbi:probable peroxisomal acyl-coenzyme A oxidase 1 isoform X2 [Adelges cooleyi]|uniref:probable peroxisomal acyl-coenzyme A oxidase 1 isoform X2 n=1 Tax=Adelges cooleyi TaxID=133065 RepID=UPI00218042B2|nr:probable peroxisomal acyl-coenzyme A oxidase 1 isoform X2 [Adelges cooleyi]